MSNGVPEEVFQKACIRYAHRYKLTMVDDWSDLEGHLKEMFQTMRYTDIVRPFICDDRWQRQMSWLQLSIKYNIPVSTIWRMAGCCNGKSISVSEGETG